MRIVSLNLNGIRSAARKDYFPWMQAQDADVFCLQEWGKLRHVKLLSALEFLFPPVALP